MPSRSASAPLKRAAVRARWRVCGTPMRAATKGAIWAGTMPIAVSLMAKPAPSVQIATSETQSMPKPPAMA